MLWCFFMDIILWYVGQSDMFEYMEAQESGKIERITLVGTADIEKKQELDHFLTFKLYNILD